MRILFCTSGSGSILNFILKNKIVKKTEINLFGDFKKSCFKIASKNNIKKSIYVPNLDYKKK